MKISDILRDKGGPDGSAVITIAPGDAVADAVSTLARNNIGALVVTDSSGVIGILSERDVVRGLHERGSELLGGLVSRAMTASVVSCTVDDDVDQIAETMTERRIRHMPVLDGEQLIGLVSIGDVVKSRIKQLEVDRVQLEHYITG